jgi:2-hydroxychromene-2-carboxylate isomerase
VTEEPSVTADVELFFDPVCPFCWVTSRWMRQVERLADVRVAWRLISLARLNDRPGAYDDKPDSYPALHARGHELLRVVAAARERHGQEIVGPLYQAMGEELWETPAQGIEDVDDLLEVQARGIDVAATLAAVGLPSDLAAARSEQRWDEAIAAETDEAIDRVGDDVGTPILSFDPPDGPAFFGPVISDNPSDEEALRYWDALTTLAEMPGFAEVKRTMRTFPATVRTAALAGTATTAG